MDPRENSPVFATSHKMGTSYVPPVIDTSQYKIEKDKDPHGSNHQGNHSNQMLNIQQVKEDLLLFRN
jgi:hypothetical protein